MVSHHEILLINETVFKAKARHLYKCNEIEQDCRLQLQGPVGMRTGQPFADPGSNNCPPIYSWHSPNIHVNFICEHILTANTKVT